MDNLHTYFHKSLLHGYFFKNLPEQYSSEFKLNFSNIDGGAKKIFKSHSNWGNFILSYFLIRQILQKSFLLKCVCRACFCWSMHTLQQSNLYYATLHSYLQKQKRPLTASMISETEKKLLKTWLLMSLNFCINRFS